MQRGLNRLNHSIQTNQLLVALIRCQKVPDDRLLAGIRATVVGSPNLPLPTRRPAPGWFLRGLDLLILDIVSLGM